MVTIKQMAEMLGVSTTTISNVIHGKTKEVSKETVKRVNELIEACEYVPNINARNLAQNKSKIIGLAIKPRQSKYKKTTKDIFINEKISLRDRDLWPVVVDSKGVIVWLPGLKKSKFDKQKDEIYDIILKYS